MARVLTLDQLLASITLLQEEREVQEGFELIYLGDAMKSGTFSVRIKTCSDMRHAQIVQGELRSDFVDFFVHTDDSTKRVTCRELQAVDDFAIQYNHVSVMEDDRVRMIDRGDVKMAHVVRYRIWESNEQTDPSIGAKELPKDHI